jgi:DNA-binding SARP family transcriptional activator/tetratricopeptide (TPR) repeat protein
MEAWTLTSESVLPPGRKTRALLAMVALAAPRPVLRSRLAEMLWSRRPEEQARASLRQEIHRLLEVLEPVGEVLIVARDQITLRPGVVWIDVEEVLRATTAHPASLSLLDGELLDGLDGVDAAFDAWLVTERERLSDRARNVAEALLRVQTEPEMVIPAAQQLLSIDRAHEGAWRALMSAHAARGERGMAIQAYERCRAVLADLLDATPSGETQRLVAEIRAGRGGALAPAPAGDENNSTPLPRRNETRLAGQRGGARVGVLPLEMVGTTEAEMHLAQGLAEEVTAALARFRWMFLVSSTSLARYAEQSRDETAIRRTFGIDFLLDGSIQRVGNRLRISLRLLDLRAGNQVVWARRFDRQPTDLLALQDEIAAEVVAQIDPEILLIEGRRAAYQSHGDATSYDLMLRAIPLIGRLERGPFMQAGDFLRRAIAQDGENAAAHAWLAYWQMFLVGQDWTDDPLAVMAAAGRSADRAVALDNQDARALTISGHVRAYLHHRMREAIGLHERALAANPNLAMAWALSAFANLYMGEVDEAERRLARYKRLSPIDPHAFFYDGGFVVAALLKRDYDGAVVAGREVTEMNPSFSAACKPYLAALGHLGDHAEALQIRHRLLSIEPGFSVHRFITSSPFGRPEDTANYAEGLRLAGVPEHATEVVHG